MNTPENIFIQTTNLCSANCVFCPHSLGYPNPQIMPDKMFGLLVRNLSAVKFKKLIYGYNCDPFLDGAIIKRLELLREYLPKQVEIELSTHLMLCEKPKMAKLKNLNITQINVMLFGYSPFAYKRFMPNNNHDLVYKNLLDIIELFKDTSTIINIVTVNHPSIRKTEIDAIENIAKDNNLKFTLVDIPEKHRFCTNLFKLHKPSSIYIDATGCVCTSSLNSPRYIAGNILDRDNFDEYIPLKKVLESEEYKTAYENFHKDYNI